MDRLRERAETWALAQALRHSVPGAAVLSDCLSVVKRFNAGKTAATSSAVKLAKLWRQIFEYCSCFEHPEREVKVVSMPAHTSCWQIGVARKSDGAKLTKEDRDGNAEADKLAKMGAGTQRIPRWLREKVAVCERVATRAALQLGITTQAANEHPVVCDDGKGGWRTRLTRDSEGDPKAKAAKNLSKRFKTDAKAEKTVVSTAEGKTRSRTTTKAEKTCDDNTEAASEIGVKRKRATNSTTNSKRLRTWLAGIAKGEPATPVTQQWLVREGAKLSAAAQEDTFSSFLVTPSTCEQEDLGKSPSSECSGEQRRTSSTTSPSERLCAAPALRTRPTRSQAGSISDEVKRTKLDMLKLIGSANSPV